ncbi:hypothetical protein J4Q44_G00230660 [Coregonus suidteri]|uniref:Uncharacterized protein n=1 Tax=Coregonus suidteri TaxID=861788 RepID=A0AAN8QNJ7_9TELE
MKACWKNVKAKKDAAEERRGQFQTGGGPPFKGTDPLSQKICEMIPQQFAPLLNPYDDDGQLDPPIFIELTPCTMEKQQCLDLAPAAKTPDRPSKRPRTDMNQAHMDVLELEREKSTAD